MQLPPRYSVFWNLLCSTTNILRLRLIGFLWRSQPLVLLKTIALDILNTFWQDRAYYWSSSQKIEFIVFIVSYFLFLCHFSVVVDYQKFNCLPDDILCKITIWADDTALNSQLTMWQTIWLAAASCLKTFLFSISYILIFEMSKFGTWSYLLKLKH